EGEPARPAVRRRRRRRAPARVRAAHEREAATDEGARSARLAARLADRLERALARLELRSPAGRSQPALLLPPVRAPRRRARAAAVEARLAPGALRRADADGPRLRRRRRLPVRDARRLLESEGDRGQCLRAVLPRQLRLLGPVDLLALPRRRDYREPRPRSPRKRAPSRPLRSRRDLRDLGRAAALVLAVELRRADRRDRRRVVLRLALAGGRRGRTRCSRRPD